MESADDLTPLHPNGAGGDEEASAEAKANKEYMSFFSYLAVFFMVLYRSQEGHWPRQRHLCRFSGERFSAASVA